MDDGAVRLRVVVPGGSIGYDVVLGGGIAATLPRLLRDIGVSGRLVLCTDTTVGPLHAEPLAQMLRDSGWETPLWAMPAGEAHKTLCTVEHAYAWLATQRIERDDTVVAVGGGVVGDLAGFVAATYLRGLRLVQVPTTLVAQVDSALGGKVGVDLAAGKNLVGAFHQPALVVGDSGMLATLPEREWRAGLAEVVKHGIIRDRDLLATVQERRDAILAREPAAVSWLVARAAGVKVAVIAADPYEQGLRRILNYGHTLGHAIEAVAGYGVVLHGEAVAWGMCAAARIGASVGTCNEEFVAWQDGLLRAYGLLAPLPHLRADDLVAATRVDKKNAGGRVRWVLPRQPGDVVVVGQVPDVAVRAAAGWLEVQSAQAP